ncbi:cadherin 26 [Labeo rohita]|uniref:Cadherin 26 n=1 Tax=Labeo rohita TaxID=84645 RepID=A0A498NUW2_LABRO|nr:cadherin 26 [Labeo rohita]
MEVNVDMLEQMDLMDISDQEALDVFFSASGEEGSLTSPLPALGHADTEEDGLRRNDLSLRISDPCEIKSRILSTSSNSTCDSQASNEDGSNTPVVQSDDEDVHEDSLIKLDRSYLVEFRLKGKGVDEDPKDVLSIDPNTGVIKVHRKVDYEQYSVLMLTFQARNKSNLAIDTQLGMEVKILDINDNPPVFQRRVYDVTINEAAKQGGFIVGVLAIDRDAPGTPNSTIDYKIMSVTPTTKNVEFYIQESGAISFKGCFDYEPLDFEQKAEQKLTIFVENEEPYFSCEVKERPAAGLWTIITNPPKPSSRNITITVEDANDPPFFPDPVRKVIVEENGAVGAYVDKVTAVDPDTGRPHKLEYSIEQDPAGWFRVDKTTGEIFVKESLDRESSHVTNGTYTITVLVTEKDDHPPMTSTATIQVYIDDKNDNVPILKENMVSVCQSDEVSSTEITAYDPDGDPYSGPFSFEIIGDHKEGWSFDPSHACLLLSLTCSCGTVKSLVQVDSVLEDALLPYNIETPGTDCMVPNILLKQTSVSHSKDATLIKNEVQQTDDVQRVSSKIIGVQSLPAQMDESWSRDRSLYSSEGSSFSRRSSQRRQGTYFISRSTLQSLLSQLKANFVLHVTQILLELKFYKVQQVWNSQKYNQQGQTVKNLAMSNESYLQVVSQGKHQGKTQEDNEDHRDIEVTTKTQRRPAGAWSQIRSEALTAARVPQMAQRQSLSLRKVTACVHKSEKESKKKSDNVFIESLIDSGVN